MSEEDKAEIIVFGLLLAAVLTPIALAVAMWITEH